MRRSDDDTAIYDAEPPPFADVETPMYTDPELFAAYRRRVRWELYQAITDADNEGLPPHCRGDKRATGTKPQREYVAENLCPGCPIFDACFTAGIHERNGVWGGVDRGAPMSVRERLKSIAHYPIEP